MLIRKQAWWLAVRLGQEKWVIRSGQDTMEPPTRDDLAAAFQRPDPNPAAAVVIQHGARWLVADNRWVFLIGRSSEPLPVGEMHGFSQRLGEPDPVLLDIMEPDA